jgi:hypothetical protein
MCVGGFPSKPRPVDDLVVNDQLSPTVVDDQRPNAASAIGESCFDLAVEPALIDDAEALLDIARLGHADDQTIPAQVQNAVLLVDRAQHALDVDAGLGIAHERALFLQLTRKEVDPQVSVLAGLGRYGDADDLAGTALKDDEVTDADELTRDRDGVGGKATARLDEADLLTDALADAAGATLFIFDDHLVAFIPGRVEGMGDTLGGTLEAAAERVVFTLVVVVTHVVAARLVDFDVFFFDTHFFAGATALVLDVVGRIGAAAVVALREVELGLEGLVSDRSAIDFDGVFSIVSAAAAFDVDVDLGVFVLHRLSVAKHAGQHVFFSRRASGGPEQAQVARPVWAWCPRRNKQRRKTYRSRRSSTSG